MHVELSGEALAGFIDGFAGFAEAVLALPETAWPEPKPRDDRPQFVTELRTLERALAARAALDFTDPRLDSAYFPGWPADVDDAVRNAAREIRALVATWRWDLDAADLDAFRREAARRSAELAAAEEERVAAHGRLWDDMRSPERRAAHGDAVARCDALKSAPLVGPERAFGPESWKHGLGNATKGLLAVRHHALGAVFVGKLKLAREAAKVADAPEEPNDLDREAYKLSLAGYGQVRIAEMMGREHPGENFYQKRISRMIAKARLFYKTIGGNDAR